MPPPADTDRKGKNLVASCSALTDRQATRGPSAPLIGPNGTRFRVPGTPNGTNRRARFRVSSERFGVVEHCF